MSIKSVSHPVTQLVLIYSEYIHGKQEGLFHVCFGDI